MAAQVMTEAYYVCETTEKADDQEAFGLVAIMLRGLLPHLKGEITAHAAEIVYNPNRAMQDMAFARGVTAEPSV